MSVPSSSQAGASVLGKKANDTNAVLVSKKRRSGYTAAIRKKKFDRWLEGHRYYRHTSIPTRAGGDEGEGDG
jgi:hypothetical protein